MLSETPSTPVTKVFEGKNSFVILLLGAFSPNIEGQLFAYYGNSMEIPYCWKQEGP